MLKKCRKGFTLAELLIIVSVIAVLVAIAIPVFSSQLEKSREAADAANIRAQYAEVMVEAVTTAADVNADGTEFPKVQLKQKKDNWQNTTQERNLHSIASLINGQPSVTGSPSAGGTAWVSYQNGVITIHYEDGPGGSGGEESPGGSETPDAEETPGAEVSPGGEPPADIVPPGTKKPVPGLRLPGTENEVNVKSPVDVQLKLNFIVHNGGNGNGNSSISVDFVLDAGETKTIRVPAAVKNSSLEVELVDGAITAEQLDQLIKSIEVVSAP